MPTIAGREEMYQHCRQAYEEQGCGPHQLEFITEHGHHAVGMAWQAGGSKATGDYIHLTNDDCEPRPGWWQAAIEAVEAGNVPCPMVYGVDGTPQSPPVWGQVAPDWTPVHVMTVPFMSRAQWEKIQPLFTAHYFTDNFITDRAVAAGWPCVLRIGYAFTHLWAQHGRGAWLGSENARLDHDRPLYEQALAMVKAGEWNEPWPPNGGLGDL
jgi:hypothetical protein